MNDGIHSPIRLTRITHWTTTVGPLPNSENSKKLWPYWRKAKLPQPTPPARSRRPNRDSRAHTRSFGFVDNTESMRKINIDSVADCLRIVITLVGWSESMQECDATWRLGWNVSRITESLFLGDLSFAENERGLGYLG